MWGLLAPTPLGSAVRSTPAKAPCGHFGYRHARGLPGCVAGMRYRASPQGPLEAAATKPPHPEKPRPHLLPRSPGTPSHANGRALASTPPGA